MYMYLSYTCTSHALDCAVGVSFNKNDYVCLLLSGEQCGLVYSEVLMNVYEDIARKHEQCMKMIESVYGKNNTITHTHAHTHALVYKLNLHVHVHVSVTLQLIHFSQNYEYYILH